MSRNGAVIIGTGFPAAAPDNTFVSFLWDASGVRTLGVPGYSSINLHSVSADGGTVVGWGTNDTTSVSHAFKWAGTTATDLGNLGAGFGDAFADFASADGSTVVGRNLNTSNSNRPIAFRWTGGVLTSLGILPGYDQSSPTGISANGTVVFGIANASNLGHAFRWESGTMQDVSPLAHIVGTVLGSDDGSVIVTSDTSSSGRKIVWRWVGDANGGVATDIGSLSGSTGAVANAISADGTIIVGASAIAGNSHAFRWTNGTFTDLNTLGGLKSVANDITADGIVTVGWAQDSGQVQRAVRWTDLYGVETISSVLAKSGVDVSGWSLTSATFISDDGSIIVGSGEDAGSVAGIWIVHCANACAITSTTTAAQSFSGLGATTATAATYLGSQFDEAGHMADAGKTGSITGFASGAFDSDPTTSAAIGATYSLGNDLVVGGSLGAAGILTNTPFNGSATFSGPSVTAFLASRPDEGANWLIGGSLVGLSGTVTRGYLNGNTPVTSTGSTTGTGAAFTAEAGWTFKDLVANTLVTPFVSATVSSISYAGYTETGGPFPATFSPFSATTATFRFGAEGRYAFAKDSTLSARVAYAHTFGSGSTITGSIPGIIALSVPGATTPADMLEAGVGIDLPIKDKIRANARLGVTIPLTDSPSLQASAGVSMAF